MNRISAVRVYLNLCTGRPPARIQPHQMKGGFANINAQCLNVHDGLAPS